MKRFKQFLFLLLFSPIALSAWAAEDCWQDQGCRRLTGIGLGAVREDDKRPLAVRQLAAIRAAKLEAMRSLAEQAKGVNLTSQTESASSELSSDRISVETQGSLQGIRFIRVEPLDGRIYQAVAELDLRNER